MMMKFWNAGELVELLGPDAGDRARACRGSRCRGARSASAQAGCGIASSDGTKNSVTANTPSPTTRPRTIAPSTYAAKSSSGDSGGSRMKIRLPVIFDWISDDDAVGERVLQHRHHHEARASGTPCSATLPPNTDTFDSSTCEKMSR